MGRVPGCRDCGRSGITLSLKAVFQTRFGHHCTTRTSDEDKRRLYQYHSQTRAVSNSKATIVARIRRRLGAVSAVVVRAYGAVLKHQTPCRLNGRYARRTGAVVPREKRVTTCLQTHSHTPLVQTLVRDRIPFQTALLSLSILTLAHQTASLLESHTSPHFLRIASRRRHRHTHHLASAPQPSAQHLQPHQLFNAPPICASKNVPM